METPRGPAPSTARCRCQKLPHRLFHRRTRQQPGLRFEKHGGGCCGRLLGGETFQGERLTRGRVHDIGRRYASFRMAAVRGRDVAIISQSYGGSCTDTKRSLPAAGDIECNAHCKRVLTSYTGDKPEGLLLSYYRPPTTFLVSGSLTRTVSARLSEYPACASF